VTAFAAARGVALETAQELIKGAPVAEALELMLSIAADGPAGLCTHGDVMMSEVEELATAGVLLDGPLEFQKCATWIFDVDRGAVAGARYLPPP
jgi:hypothetical protein